MRLQELKNEMAEDLYSMTTEEAIVQGICIQCKKAPKYYSEAGRREYYISGLCEFCWDEIMEGME